MALRLPLRPSSQSGWAVDLERLALAPRESRQFIDTTERVVRCVRLYRHRPRHGDGAVDAHNGRDR